MINRYLTIFLVSISMTLSSMVVSKGELLSSPVPDYLSSINAKTETWQGYSRYNFKFQNYDCFITAPLNPLPSNPWVWRARFPTYHAQVDSILLEKGFHVAYINPGPMLGSPRARDIWDEFYQYITEKIGLSSIVALEAVSRGGLFAYNWAARNPEKVSCIYGDVPVLDFRSWPGGMGIGTREKGNLNNLLNQYGFTEEEFLKSKDIPLEKLGKLANANIPILHVVSTKDMVVPPSENSFILEKKYRALGGRVTILINKQENEGGKGHQFPLDDPGLAAKFIFENTPLPPLADGTQWYQVRGGLRNSFVKFSHEKTGRVAFLGGSITQNPGWQWMVAQYLREKFPETKFEFINAGISSTGSTPAAFRLETDVLSKGTMDLLFEEAAVNDLHNGRKPIEQLRAMEGIVRHARHANPQMDIVLLHFSEPRHTAEYSKGNTPEIVGNHEKVAAHYSIPSINLAREVHDRIKAGQFGWDKDFVNLHPSPFGQRLYYWSIRRLLDNAWSDSLRTDEKMTNYSQPSELDPQCYSGGKFADISNAGALNGFDIDPQCHPNNGGSFYRGFVDVPMLVADKPGDSFEYEFNGRGVGLFVIAGPDSGIVEYSIDTGPKQELDIFTQWSGHLNIPWAHMLDADLKPGHHKLKLTMSNSKNAKSKGNAIRIRNILINE